MELDLYIEKISEINPLRIVFSNKKNKDFKYIKTKINLVKKVKGSLYQIENFTDKQVFHENIEIERLNETLKVYLEEYKQLSAMSEEYNIDLRISKKGKVLFKKHAQKNKVNFTNNHNKKKNYILNEGMDIEPLVDLGVFSKEKKVINSKYDKYKQINRFIEIIDDEVKKVEDDYKIGKDKTFNIIDFGCGKSYLTFIMYYYFREIKKMNVSITGLDLKKDVIEKCNEIAKKYNYENLKFQLGDIKGFKFDKEIDMVITLHACDTATDYALYNAVSWDAKMIFSVPCCQHEINSSLETENLKLITKYGIIKERISALLTDSIRANILEYKGYKTQLLEFIDIEHSPKNILIRATKSNISEKRKKEALKEIIEIKKQFSFNQKLIELFDIIK